MRAILISALALLAACSTTASAPQPVAASSANITSAIADTRRPDEDRTRDANRHPAETLAFSEIRPGARVGEFFAGSGYFTRLLAVAVGPEGRVYPVVRPEGVAARFELPVLELSNTYPNVAVARTLYTDLTFPEPLDVVFTAQNYHDLAIADFGFGDRNQTNRAAFAALRPGGLYVIIDHSAPAGSAVQTAARGNTHRIDEAVVREEVEAAGFVFDGDAQFLRNAEDPRTDSVFNNTIRGHTDQFVLRFRKPG